MTNGSTAKDVANWLVANVLDNNQVYQDTAVHEIANQFGDQFVYINGSGNLSISKEVLKAFREMSEETIVWEKGERCWRVRQTYDFPGRRQD